MKVSLCPLKPGSAGHSLPEGSTALIPLPYELSNELDTNIHANPGSLLGKEGHVLSLTCEEDPLLLCGRVVGTGKIHKSPLLNFCHVPGPVLST